MHAVTAATARVIWAEGTLNAVLSPTHDAWVMEARQLLMPAATPEEPFWDRWSVVRYLNDRFLEHFRVERALMSELRAFVSVHEMDMLEAGAERVARLHLTLDRISRRRGTAAEFAMMATEFLRALELWCADMELASSRVQRDTLSAEAQRMLEHLEAPSPTLCRL
jgi:hypothetical protein